MSPFYLKSLVRVFYHSNKVKFMLSERNQTRRPHSLYFYISEISTTGKLTDQELGGRGIRE